MAKQGISTGSSPNDGTGDTLLAGAEKINENFDEIYTLAGDGTNLAPGIVTAIAAGSNISISTSFGQVTVTALETTGISEMTSVHAKDSIEASSDFEDNSIDFIHFDANHDHYYVTAELEAWLPKLKEKSFIAGHDYRDLKPAVDKFFVTKKLRVLPINNYESYVVKIGGGLE